MTEIRIFYKYDTSMVYFLSDIATTLDNNISYRLAEKVALYCCPNVRLFPCLKGDITEGKGLMLSLEMF